jgi:hypothetical protein
MEERLSILKNDFNAIIDFKENNISSLQLLGTRIKKIKGIYADFINVNRDNLFVFTLDSFHFQGKLIDIEYEDMMRLFYAITNRMYCDYYKLFKIIIEYVNEYVPDKKLSELIRVNDSYPTYKDLEPFKQYEFHYIQSLHEIILVILTYLNTFIINKNHDLKVYQSKNKIGLNIDSFVNTFNFNNTVMKEKTGLFITYIEFFHKLHTKYLKRFTMKLQLMMSQINNDIKLDDPNESKNTKKDILNDFKENNIDKKILQEIKISVSDENSTISTSDQSKTPSSRTSSTSESGDSSNHCINTPTNTPEPNYIFNNIEPINIFENVSELSDDNKFENNSEPRFKIPIIHTIIEGVNEDQTVNETIIFNDIVENETLVEEGSIEDEDNQDEMLEKEYIDNIIEEPSKTSEEITNEIYKINNISVHMITESDNKKKKKKKKKNKNTPNISFPNITI